MRQIIKTVPNPLIEDPGEYELDLDNVIAESDLEKRKETKEKQVRIYTPIEEPAGIRKIHSQF